HRDHGPTKQGFDEFFGIRDGFIDNYNHFYLHREGFHDLYEGTQEVWAKGRYFPEMITQRSLDFIERNKERPFFLYLAFNIPHYPEQHLEQHGRLYASMPMPRRTYAATVTTTDYYIGQVIDRLESLGLRDNTVIIFQSDNGHSEEDYQIRIEDSNSGYPRGHNYGPNGGGGNTGKWIGHKGTFLEGGVRTPAIISFPAELPMDVVRDQAVTIMDWFPTVLELCRVDKPEVTLDGKTMLPVIHSATTASQHKVFHFQWQNNWAVREGDWKLIGRKQGRDDASETLSLHSLTDEAPEVRDYVDVKPEIVKKLHAMHGVWAESVSAR
ncbi:MAG: sulfatase-like hydrolase/transferase, partial [Gammaproteobacteria bacterium]|nr:sulfatase-like hydrolase/transferase [Gammaproteobacteria bacterium]